MKNFSGGIWDEIVLAVPGCIPIRRQDAGSNRSKMASKHTSAQY